MDQQKRPQRFIILSTNDFVLYLIHRQLVHLAYTSTHRIITGILFVLLCVCRCYYYKIGSKHDCRLLTADDAGVSLGKDIPLPEMLRHHSGSSFENERISHNNNGCARHSHVQKDGGRVAIS